MNQNLSKIEKTKRNYQYWIFGSIAAACLGVLQFCIFVWVAFAYYPESFSLSTHLLTDLGRDANDYGHIFNISIVVLGLLLVPLFVVLPVVETRNSYSKYVVAIAGSCSSLGLIILGITPNDIYFFEHYAAMLLWLAPTVITIMAFYYLVSNNPNMSAWFIATCLVTIVVTLMFLMGSQESNRMIFQRILLAYALVWFGFVAYFAFRCGRMALDFAMLDHLSNEDMADEYRYQLMSQKDHRR